MRRRFITCLLFFVLCAALLSAGGTKITHGSGSVPARQSATVTLVNAASYEAVVAPGSIAALFGDGLATQTQVAPSLPLPTTMAGVSVKIGGRNAPLFFVSPGQINLQAPSGVAVGNATIEVFLNNAATPAQTGTVAVAEAAPGLFTINASGRGQSAALNADYSINADFDQIPGARPELAGGVVILYATGIGNTNPPVADGQAAPASPLAVGAGATTVAIGGVNAPVLFSGLAPGFVGLWQINVQLPDTLPTNAATNVRITKGRTSLEATLAIAGKNDFGALTGTVSDGLSGARISQATLTLPQPNNLTRTVKTNAQGAFSLPLVRTGSYNLQATAAGFGAETQNVTVTANATSATTITLAKQKPNLILITADDLGYADLGAQGSADVVTPNIDSIARNGIRFTNAYVSAPVCSPSRAGFLTGRYQQRFGYELNPDDGDRTYGLPANELTIANRLKAFGYTNGVIGKWHLGVQPQFHPLQRGFDEFFGFSAGGHSYTDWNVANNPIYRGTQPVVEDTYLTDAFSREAVDFIARHQSRPFFLHLSYNAPHTPLQATEAYRARFPSVADNNRRNFLAMMAAMDDGIGLVLAKLRELQLEENTLIVFFSDNGGPTTQNTSRNTPLSGSKDRLQEGGIRIPFMLQWKGYLPAGQVSQNIVSSLDFAATALAAAQGRKGAEATLDGVNLIPWLAGVETAAPHDRLFWRSGAAQYAARVGDWKLLFVNNTTALYNLADDVGEQSNLAQQNPAKLAELQTIYQTWNAQLPAAPVITAWITQPRPNANPNLARVQPEVHTVTVLDRHVGIQSGGITLYYLGPLQTPADHVERIRRLRFRIPRFPAPAKGARSSVRPDVLGVFLNGVPIYNQFEASSYQGQNLWHFDTVAGNDDGATVAGGHSQDLRHRSELGLLAEMIADASRHSPMLGYAFDGYPIYGPWGFAKADGTGGLRRMRSGYQLRRISRRDCWADGTQLTPGQHGPPVNAEFPLGAFVEDYEYVAGAGDLDEFNGRFTVTPEYPAGAYAYFLSTDARGRLAYPYLLANRYYGQATGDELQQAFRDEAVPENRVTANRRLLSLAKPQLSLNVRGAALAAGQPLRLSFAARQADGRPARFLEYVHERPLHLLIVSEDLAEFAHIHPELVAGGHYDITHTFPHGGRYRLYADFTPPGATQRIETFTVNVAGPRRPPAALKADPTWTKQSGALQITLATRQKLRAGEDIEFTLSIRDAGANQPIADLEPYLGAWAHFVIIDRRHESFIHAHPLEAGTRLNVKAETQPHKHSALISAPAPAEIRTITSFPRPGLYKLWAQFQRGGQSLAQPFVLNVSAAAQPPQPMVAGIPDGAIQLNVSASGFAPAQLTIPSGKPVRLVVTRDRQPNCGQRIVFPALGLTKELALGGSVLIDLPALATGELRFTCGMGMYQGSIIAQ